jgi:hypothetical protein
MHAREARATISPVSAQVIVGGALVSGLVVFMVGTSAWRLAYDEPLPEPLPLIHADGRRRAWIHLWMIVWRCS